MGKPSPPPAPDYAAAATAQGVANKDSGITTASLSNPNIVSPYGNQTVTYDQTGPDGNPQPTVTQTLTPEAQQTLDAQQRVQLGLANLGQQGLGTAQDVLGKSFQYNGPEIQTGLPQTGAPNYGPTNGQYGMAQGFDPSQYGQAQGINAGVYGQAQGIGAGPNAQNSLNLSGIAQMPVNAGMTAQNAILSRLQPQIQQRNDALTQQLANQGITSGSEAYNRAQTQQGQNNNDLLTQAALQGIGIDMSANAQGYGQQLSSANLYNQALGQDFGQRATAQQLGNAAIGQNFNQGSVAQQLQNSAINQNAGLGLQGNQASNAAMNQNYNQAATNAGLYNQAQNQQFNQGLQGSEFGNQAALQRYQQQLAQYNQPLNQIAALMSGLQIQNPQFQQYTGSNVAAAPVFQAAQQQGQYDLGSYAQQMAGYNAMIGGIADLGGAAIGSKGLFSDRRLKSNIQKIGEHPKGFGIYEYDIFGRRERGVMAQEVREVMPQAVLVHPSGFLMVDYGAINA